MIEEQIKELKKEYLNTPLPRRLETMGWENVVERLETTSSKKSFFRYYPLVFVGVLFALTGTVVLAAQSAQPGSALYPIQQLTTDVAESIFERTEPIPSPAPLPTTAPAVQQPTSTPTPTPENTGTGNDVSNSVRNENSFNNPSIENKQRAEEKREVRGENTINQPPVKIETENKGQAISEEKKSQNGAKIELNSSELLQNILPNKKKE